MNNPIDRRFVPGGMLPVDNLYGTAFTGEEDAHTFRITYYEGSEAVAFTGEIAGKFINPAGVTVPLSGSLDEDGRAIVTLDEHCYAVAGRFILTIWAGRKVIYCGVGQVMNSQTDTIDYPTSGIPDVAALIEQLQDILDGWPADYTQLQSDVSDLKTALAEDVEFLGGRQSFALTASDFVMGEYYANDGTIGNSQYKIRSNRLLRVSHLKPYYWTALPLSTFSVRIVQYDKNGAYVTGGTMSSRTITLNAKTEFVGVVLWKGNTTPIETTDVTSFSFDTYGNDITSVPTSIISNLPVGDKIIIRDIKTGQKFDTNNGNIKNDDAASRSLYLYRSNGNIGYLASNGSDTTILCYDKDLNYIDYYRATGLSNISANTEYIAVTIAATNISSVTLYQIDRNNSIDREWYLEPGGIRSNGWLAAIYEKDPLSYKRTTSYIRIRKGAPFRLTFGGTLNVYEYRADLSYVKTGTPTTNVYYIPDATTEYIKLESYSAPTLVSEPSITVGNKYSDGWGSDWTVDSTATNRFYTDLITLDATKQYLMTVEQENVILAYEVTQSDGSPLASFGFLNGNPIVDYLTYLNNGAKLMIRGRITSGTFSSSDKPVKLYTLSNNSNTHVTMRYAQTAGELTQKNKRKSADELPLVYDVHPLLGGEAPDDYCYTAGLIKLPSNYTENGAKVPLIVFAHGSSDYSTIDVNELSPSTRYKAYISYLVDEGYAVFDAYCWSNLLAFAKGGQWGGHVAMACIQAGIDHVIQHYNIDPNRIYVTAKSLGGLIALNLATQRNVRAVAPLAPAVDTFEGALGYNYLQRKAVFYDFGLDAGTDDANIKFTNAYLYNAPSDFTDELLDNPYAACGYNPAWNAMIDISPTNLINAEIGGTSFQSGALAVANIIKDKSRIVKAPVKIWAASDDNATSYRLCNAFITSIKNAGGDAVMRTMPDNTGGHHSVDNDTNAPKVASITTELGITHTDVPLAYVEMIQWFRQYE